MNKLFGGLLTIIVSIAFASNANAGLVFGDGSAQVAYGDQYVNSFGAVFGTNSGNVNGYRQTTAFFGNHWAITSGHGLREVDTDPGSLYSNLSVTLGSNFFTNPGETRQVSEVFINPLYNGTNNGYDLALLYFENPFSTVKPLDFYTGDIAVGMDSDIVGFGRLQFVNSFDQTLTGDLRAGNNVVSNVPYSSTNYVATRLESSSRPNYRPLGMGATSGDSGGALIVDGKIAGTTTFISGGPFYTSFTAYNVYDQITYDWIAQAVDSRPATAVPEPGSAFIFGVGTTLFGIYKRRRKLV